MKPLHSLKAYFKHLFTWNIINCYGKGESWLAGIPGGNTKQECTFFTMMSPQDVFISKDSQHTSHHWPVKLMEQKYWRKNRHAPAHWTQLTPRFNLLASACCYSVQPQGCAVELLSMLIHSSFCLCKMHQDIKQCPRCYQIHSIAGYIDTFGLKVTWCYIHSCC